jgi:hypothetical protein
MPKFRVTVAQTVVNYYYVEVDAENASAAGERAVFMVENGDDNGEEIPIDAVEPTDALEDIFVEPLTSGVKP